MARNINTLKAERLKGTALALIFLTSVWMDAAREKRLF